MRKTVAASGGRVLPDSESPAKAQERIAADGRVQDGDPVRAELAALLAALAATAREPEALAAA